MPKPYVLRIVSLGSGAGKTHLGSKLVSILIQRGYKIGVIKHCAEGITLEDKDSKKYLDVNALQVVLSTKGVVVVYNRNHEDTLEEALKHTSTPLVLVEGFKTSSIGDSILVVRSEEELRKLLGVVVNPIAVYTMNDVVKPIDVQIPLYRSGEEELLADLVEKKMIEYFYSQIPRLNCGMCGYSTCNQLINKYVRGESYWCPIVSNVEISVDGREIPLNPFVKNIVRNIVVGITRSLKGVPEAPKKIKIEVSLE